ncbi:hypothetical protein ACHAW5_005823 [Stephanodiscus triporus]|uniref:Uncharacterized protein n=1 Tax=Stephanodiscus triporus TaxID=2934178 RepID=A0ABD3PXK1_9STRA
MNTTRAIRCWSLAAIMGDVSRFSLGNYEAKVVGNMNRAKKHWMIAASAGHNGALEKIKHGYTSGTVTKDEYERSLRAHKDSVDEMHSEHRSKAMARHRSKGMARKEIFNMFRPKVRSGNGEEECNCIDWTKRLRWRIVQKLDCAKCAHTNANQMLRRQRLCMISETQKIIRACFAIAGFAIRQPPQMPRFCVSFDACLTLPMCLF